ncbi:acyl-CoA dehydrogenase family protein [Chitinimonas taiwanensis]|uniref:acyl-CoA dehydrogenase family protein n=1 Tax=Chitinimonas taiwanensis TaxID=240412 RepID=UPI0035B0AFA5
MTELTMIDRLLPPRELHRKPEPDTAATGPLQIAAQIAAQLAKTAVERDRAGGHPAAERSLLRNSGLLWLAIPREYGGQGERWLTIYRAVRTLAEADSALAHLFAFHHLQILTVLLYGSSEQQARLLGSTVAERRFWGNALNPLDKRTRAQRLASGWQIDGLKSFSSGSVGSDMLSFSAWDEASQSALIGVLPTLRKGITVQADWDAFGQRQTDSGTVSFEQVALPPEDVLQAPGAPTSPRQTLRACAAQLVLANLYVGIAQGAFAEARRYTLESARPWFAAGVARPADDPYIQKRYGELWLKIRPAALLADEAARLLDAALAKGEALTAAERGEVAITVAEAKALAHEASLSVSTELFDLAGARATSQRYGLDRFWRNARTHTLHDPIDYKLRDIGRWALEGQHPEPTPYS